MIQILGKSRAQVGPPEAVTRVVLQQERSPGSDDHSELREQMMALTGASLENCNFFLESMEWDLQKAIDTWKGVSPRSP